MPARTLYAAQLATITPNAGGACNLPVQSASCELTLPVDDIMILGRLGSAGRFQKEVATCKADLKVYLGTDNTDPNTLSGAFLSVLTGEALAGNVSTVTVTPNGFIMSGILTHIGLELSLGIFGMGDFSFAGVGEPVFAAVPTTIGGAGTQPGAAVAIVPLTTGVKIYDITKTTFNNTCPKSVKFSLDIPNEIISCLGSPISGSQVVVAAGNVQVAKPPFHYTLVCEGTAAEASSKLVFGETNACITIVANDGVLQQRGFNQAAGDVGSSYNFSVEGSDCTIS